MKYKVGDRLRARKDLSQDKAFGGCYISENMEKLAGQIVTISEKNEMVDYYKIEEDYAVYNWKEEMFEGFATFTKADLRDGDICTLGNGEREMYKANEGVGILRNRYIKDDLTNSGIAGSTLDIVKVERPTQFVTMYERKESVTMTIEEIEEKLGLASGTLKIKEE